MAAVTPWLCGGSRDWVCTRQLKCPKSTSSFVNKEVSRRCGNKIGQTVAQSTGFFPLARSGGIGGAMRSPETLREGPPCAFQLLVAAAFLGLWPWHFSLCLRLHTPFSSACVFSLLSDSGHPCLCCIRTLLSGGRTQSCSPPPNNLGSSHLETGNFTPPGKARLIKW